MRILFPPLQRGPDNLNEQGDHEAAAKIRIPRLFDVSNYVIYLGLC